MALKVIYEYTTTISVPKPLEEEMNKVRRTLNFAISGQEQFQLGEVVPQEVKDAHWNLNAGKHQEVRVVVYDNGAREINEFITMGDNK